VISHTLKEKTMLQNKIKYLRILDYDDKLDKHGNSIKELQFQILTHIMNIRFTNPFRAITIKKMWGTV
jgi:hypothetical protein